MPRMRLFDTSSFGDLSFSLTLDLHNRLIQYGKLTLRLCLE